MFYYRLTRLNNKIKTMNRYRKETYFVLASLWDSFEIPNSIFILKSFLKKRRIASSKIIISPLESIFNNKKIRVLRNKNVFF